MNIEIDINEIISLQEFELGWRFEKSHCPNISDAEKEQIVPVSKTESKRLYKIINYFDNEQYLKGKFIESDWLRASSENEEKIKQFESLLKSTLVAWNDAVFISWGRNITLKTTKQIFVKYLV